VDAGSKYAYFGTMGNALTLDALEQFYDAYPRIEAEFQAALDESLEPRAGTGG